MLEDDPFEESPDEYLPSSASESSDEEYECRQSKKKKLAAATSMDVDEPQPCTHRQASQNRDLVQDTIEQVILTHQDSSETEAQDESPGPVDGTTNNLTWSDVSGAYLKNFIFTEEHSGVKAEIYETYFDKTPFEFYKMFLDQGILDMMVEETNRYAAQVKNKATNRKARINDWYDTNTDEIQIFIGILFWMGLAQFPSIESYWSRKNIYYNRVKNQMSRNRFQILLKTWHFSNNEEVAEHRLQKINPLLTKLLENFQNPIIPAENICIDETLVPFQGRLVFKQYIKNKRHKFGIKLYKLCLDKGYTYNVQVYCGQDKTDELPASKKVVLSLSDTLLEKGRTIYTDNFYTSLSLAHKLLSKNTHLVGTLRANRKLNPKHVIDKKLKVGETIASESNTGVVVQKWKDKRDVLTLSTKHTDEMKTVTFKRREILKPTAVLDYNQNKSFIDMSDQMKAYASSLRRGVKWYRKLAIELLIGAATVNAYILHQEVANERMSITKFKEEIVMDLLNIRQAQYNVENVQDNRQHNLQDEGTKRRRRCVVCYEKLQQENNRAYAQHKTPQSRYKCVECEQHYCLACFFFSSP